MITLQELWYAWCDIDEHTEVQLQYEGDEDFVSFKFGERGKWRQYDSAIVRVFSVIQANKAQVTRGAFNKVLIILQG